MLSGIKFISKDKRKVNDLLDKAKEKVKAKSYEVFADEINEFDVRAEETNKSSLRTDIEPQDGPHNRDNKSAAELLRCKLKGNSSGSLTLPEDASSSTVPISSAARREYLIAKHLRNISNKGKSGELSLSEMVAAEKLSSNNFDNDYQMLELFSARGLAAKSHSGADEESRDEDDIFSKKRKTRKGGGIEAGSDSDNEHERRDARKSKRESDAHKTIRSDIKRERFAGRCLVCNGSIKSQLQVAQSPNVVLNLKESALSLAEGHCELIPREHVASSACFDEQTQVEIDRFKSCLRRMFESLNMSCLFVESSVFVDAGAHCVIDVVPCYSDVLPDVILSFKEAIYSIDEDLTTHKRIIHLKETKPLSCQVPKNFPYVSIQWGVPMNVGKDTAASGLAHVIEGDVNLSQFGSSPGDFAIDAVAAALGEEQSQRARSKQVVASNRNIEQKKALFMTNWSMFDWTQYVD